VTSCPLERLAACASFDVLAAVVMSVLSRASSSIVVLVLAVPAMVPLPDAVAPLAPAAPARRVRAMGVRLTGGAVVAHVPAGLRVVLADGTFAESRVDIARGVTVVRLPANAEQPSIAPCPVAGVASFTYVAVIEAAIGGPTVAPAFVGRLDSLEDPVWGGTLLVPGGTPDVPMGALVFTLEGRFVGLVVPRPAGGRALAPLSALERAAAAGREEGKGGRP
jgi:hypothetical protein